MKAFLKSIDERVQLSVENGWERPTIAISEWSTSQKEAASFNSKAMNVIFNVISMEKFKRISNVEIAHTTWNILQTMHEGTKAVKIKKLQQLTSRFGSIRMSKDESFDEFYAKLNKIVNFAFNLGEIYNQPKIVRNIIRSLTEDFRPKMTVITESKDVDSIPIDKLVGSFQSYEFDLPKMNKSKSLALKSIDDVDDCEFDDELSSTEIAYLVKSFRNFLRNNNRKARNRNNIDTKNMKKNDIAKKNNGEKSKERVGQSSTNSLGQQCYGCQGYGPIKSECPTFLRSKGKAMGDTLSDDEVSAHEFESNQKGNFMAFTSTVVVSEIETVDENSSDGELSENADLMEAYNTLCKIPVKDTMSVELGLKKINTLELEKKNLLLKLFDANELLNFVMIKNMSLLEKVKSLELELFVTREQIDRTSTSKLDEMLHVQKPVFDKTSLGFVKNGSTTVVNPPKFVSTTSSSTIRQTFFDVKVHKVVSPASRRTRADLSESESKKSNQSGNKKNHNPQWFCHFCEIGRAHV